MPDNIADIAEMSSPDKARFALDLDKALQRLKTSSVIPVMDLDNDRSLRRGLYLVACAYGLGHRECSYAGAKFIELCKGKNEPALTLAAIASSDFDKDKYDAACAELISEENDRDNENPDDPEAYELSDFGWLAPDGEFTPSPFGTHDETADEIIDSKAGFHDEFFWEYDKFPNSREFLIEKKNYVLLHNPSGPYSHPIVSHDDHWPLSKAQREFLYDYFVKAGDAPAAARYLDDSLSEGDMP